MHRPAPAPAYTGYAVPSSYAPPAAPAADLPPAYLPPVTLSPPPAATAPGGRRRRLQPEPEPLETFDFAATEQRRTAAEDSAGTGQRTGSKAASGSASGGRRKLPAGHRKRARRRAFPAVPVAASMVTLVAATSGAMTLHGGEKANVNAAPQERAMPSGIALSLTQLGSERDNAAKRSDRSGRNSVAGGVNRTDLNRDQQLANEARDRAAWEQQRARELAGIERSSSDGDSGMVMERAVHWVLPVSGYKLSAGFGDGGSLWTHNHTGQDFAAPIGTSVRSVGAGEIIRAEYDRTYGNKIEVRHWDGTVTWYCHLSGYNRRSGSVSAGEVIGYVGSTGNSTGPHLHFEVRPYGGDPIDPLPWLRSFGLDV